MKKVFVLEPRAPDAETQKGRRKDAENAFCERSDSASRRRFCGFCAVEGRRGLADEENELGECALAFIRGSSVRR
jgi:hypothetical protein